MMTRTYSRGLGGAETGRRPGRSRKGVIDNVFVSSAEALTKDTLMRSKSAGCHSLNLCKASALNSMRYQLVDDWPDTGHLHNSSSRGAHWLLLAIDG